MPDEEDDAIQATYTISFYGVLVGLCLCVGGEEGMRGTCWRGKYGLRVRVRIFLPSFSHSIGHISAVAVIVVM